MKRAVLTLLVLLVLGSLVDVRAGHQSIEGRAGYALESYGSRYLAVPVALGGRGARVRICDASGECITRIATDAGPALSEQRKGNVADLSHADFRTLCECVPRVVGRIHVTITSLHGGVVPTLPPTDTLKPIVYRWAVPA